MGVAFYVSGRVKRLRTIPQIMEGETKAAIRRGQNKLRTAVAEEFRTRGIGAAIFRDGYSASAMKTILAREKVKKRGEVYEVGLRVKGIAAIVAKGDRTKAHKIKPQRGTVLANPATGFFARGAVDHPGSRFQRDDFPGRAMERTRGAFAAEVGKIPARIAQVIDRG